MTIEETLSKLDSLEDALLAHVQEVRAIRGEIKKQTAGGDLEALLDAEHRDGGRLILAQPKNSIAPKQASLRFCITDGVLMSPSTRA